jgi:hypothetical protein
VPRLRDESVFKCQSCKGFDSTRPTRSLRPQFPLRTATIRPAANSEGVILRANQNARIAVGEWKITLVRR